MTLLQHQARDLLEAARTKSQIMWNSSQSAGGFMNDTATTPSKGSAGGGKNKKQNIVPVMINEVLTAPGEGFTVEGMEVGMVVVCGKVNAVERAATKTTYHLEDP